MAKRKPVDVIALESISNVCNAASKEIEDIFNLIEYNYKESGKSIPQSFHEYKSNFIDGLSTLSISSNELSKSIDLSDEVNIPYEYSNAIDNLNVLRGD